MFKFYPHLHSPIFLHVPALMLLLICTTASGQATGVQTDSSANTSARSKLVKVATYADEARSAKSSVAAGSIGRPANAKVFAADITKADWKTQSGPFACSLTHPIPGFGSAVFSRKAGAAEVFYLSPQAPTSFPPGKAMIETLPPVWRSDIVPVNLGSVTAVAGDQPVKLTAKEFAALLQQLANGNKVMFTSAIFNGGGDAAPGMIRVVLDPKDFSADYKHYQQCISELIPYTFAQLSSISLTYPEKSEGLTTTSKSELNKVAKYVKVDPKVIGVLVDAHSDNKGTAEENDAKSQQQSQWVNEYLVAQGVAGDLIIARWHGDKFPVGNNKTDVGRSQNRRVTVRLESEETRKAAEERALARAAEEDKKRAAEEKKLAAHSEPQTSASASASDITAPQHAEETPHKPVNAVPPRETSRASARSKTSSQGKITPEQLSEMVNGLDLIPKQ